MLSDVEKVQLSSLILRLRNTEPLSKTTAAELRESNFSQFFGKILTQGATSKNPRAKHDAGDV